MCKLILKFLLLLSLAAHSSTMHASLASTVLPSSSHHPYTSMSHSLSSGVSPHPPPTPSPSRSPSPPPPTSTVPTPSPSPGPPNRSYMLRRNGTVCVHLKASIKTAVTYTTDNGVGVFVWVWVCLCGCGCQCGKGGVYVWF